MKRFFLTIIFYCNLFIVLGQDIQYSQFYSVPMYMNPALAGAGAPYWKGTYHTRIQWPKLHARILSNYLSIEKYFDKANSGFGAYVIHDNYSASVLNKITTSFQYSYTLQVSKNLLLKAGASIGFIYYQADASKLIFPDQFDINGLTGFNTQDPMTTNNSFSPDIGAGIMFYGSHFWAGINTSHINQQIAYSIGLIIVR